MDTGSPGWTSFGDQETTFACSCSAAADCARAAAVSVKTRNAKTIFFICVTLGGKPARLYYTACAVPFPHLLAFGMRLRSGAAATARPASGERRPWRIQTDP